MNYSILIVNTLLFTVLLKIVCSTVISSDSLIQNRLFLRPTNAFSGFSKTEASEIHRWVVHLEENQRKDKQLRFPSLWRDIQGSWLLRYTNNAQSFQSAQRNSILTSVEQQIEMNAIRHVLLFENPILPFLNKHFSSSSSLALAMSSTSKVILYHSAEVTSNSSPSQLSLDLDAIEIMPDPMNSKSSSLKVPVLGPGLLRRGYFDTTYVDDELRVSRGLFNELRVFQRV